MKKYISIVLVLLTFVFCSAAAFATEENTESVNTALVECAETDENSLSIDDGSVDPKSYQYTKSFAVICKTITIYNYSASDMKASSGVHSTTIPSGGNATFSFSSSTTHTITLKCNNPIYYGYTVT